MADNKNPQEETTIEQINNNLTDAGRKVAENKKMLFWVVGVIVIVAVFVMSYFFIYQNPKLNKAYEAYNKVEMTAMGNDTVAAKEYAKVADANNNTPGHLAALSAAESYYNIGKYAEAAKYLEKFKSSDKVLSANAYLLLGDCYVNLKKYPQALEAFEKGVKEADKNPQIAPRGLMKMAVVYDEQKQYANALDCYTQIKNEYPQFVAGNVEIDAYIERENARLGK